MVIKADPDDVRNADWPKQRWDLPTDKTKFLTALKALGISLEDFMRKPAAHAMPSKLRDALGFVSKRDGILGMVLPGTEEKRD